jgi:hypothetical protein
LYVPYLAAVRAFYMGYSTEKRNALLEAHFAYQDGIHMLMATVWSERYGYPADNPML